jgi:uncharacterized integral membrane protein (TIGR00697 family)
MSEDRSQKRYKYLGVITVFYVTMQLVSDVTAGKLINLGGYGVSVTVLYFPVTYIFADILTEVYGYARARAVLWTVLVCSVIAGLTYQLVVFLPPAAGFDANEAYVRVFSQVPRILIGGWLAVFSGEILNDFILAKLKILTMGRFLWVRTIASTIIGQLANTVVFYTIGLYGVIPTGVLIQAVLAGWILKTLVEIIMTPVTYYIVGALKRSEGEDVYDTQTNFNPLIVERPF